ncbi:MAG TPA: methyltransferase domain-containing protein [Verrucomicrobiae bacterium]|nr:methyltransferase domain-containing protein [Verrucomicrobiae bacterium]
MNRPLGRRMRIIYSTLGGRFREKRAAAFSAEFSDCRSVIDVGGHPLYWQARNWRPKNLLLLNIDPPPVQLEDGIGYLQADGCNVPFPSGSFDLAMSNSVIEHVPDQQKFASEMLRVGKRVYCQTPAKEFPVEPHCLGLFVHWLPTRWFTYFVHRYFTIYGLIGKPDRQEHEDFKQEVHLLSKSELRRMFPGCEIETERFLYLPKSYIVRRRAPSSLQETADPGDNLAPAKIA